VDVPWDGQARVSGQIDGVADPLEALSIHGDAAELLENEHAVWRLDAEDIVDGAARERSETRLTNAIGLQNAV
jgi:hypothetical protein